MAKKVLLVDDVSMFVELMRDFLQLSSVNVLTARDGQEALRICQAENPELVFMDLHMPLLDGADACRAVKATPALSSKIVLITSEGKEADRLRCLEAGCDDFLTKPLDRHVFLDAARKLLPEIERRDNRVNCRFNVKFRAFGITLSGFAANLSPNGMYLAADVDIQEGGTIDLIFVLPEPVEATIIQTRARVAWVNTTKARKNTALPAGFGVEFLSVTDLEKEQIGRYLQTLDTPTARALRVS